LVRARFDRALFGDRQPVFPRRWPPRRRIGREAACSGFCWDARGQRRKAFGRRLGGWGGGGFGGGGDGGGFGGFAAAAAEAEALQENW